MIQILLAQTADLFLVGLVFFPASLCQLNGGKGFVLNQQMVKQFLRGPAHITLAIGRVRGRAVEGHADISVPALVDFQLHILRQIVLENL